VWPQGSRAIRSAGAATPALEHGGGWSTAEKERLVAASLEPGAGVSAVAREAGVHPGQLYGWRRQLCRAQPMATFAAVRVAAEPIAAGMSAPGTIDIEFANGSRMRVTGAVDPATLAAIIRRLANVGRRR
jgi:transposase